MKKHYLFLFFLVVHNFIFSNSYKLTHSVGTQGFFSTFNTVLGALDYCDLYHDQFEVNFGETGLFYDEEHGTNWWEYYFEPIRFKVAHSSESSEFQAYQKIIFSIAAQFEMSRVHGHELIQKYIKLKSFLENKINNFVDQYFNDSIVIGIHYRGTDKKQEAPILTYEYVKNMVLQEAQNPQVKFFVATDDAHFLEYMKTSFPQRIIAIDAIRSVNEKAVHWPR